MPVKRLLLVILGVCVWSQAAPAALTLVAREAFQGVGTLNAATPGGLGTVNDGTFAKRPVGPRLSSDTSAQARGWSADTRLQFRVDHTVTSTNLFPADSTNPAGLAATFAFDWWIYLDQPAGDGNAGQVLVNLVSPYSGQTLLQLQTLASDGLTLAYVGNAGAAANTATAYTLALRRWTNFRVAVRQRANGYFEFDVSLLVRTPGGSWTELLNASDVRIYGNLPGVTAGFLNVGETPSVRGRYGMPSLYQLDAWTDRTLPVPDVVDPPTGPFAWYVNPVTGNDGNDGGSPATAWATCAKINAESQALGLFGANGGYTHGDTLTIDTTLGNLPLGPNSLQLQTQGLHVAQTGGGPTGAGEIQAWAALPAGGWSLVSGATKTYQQTLSESNPSCVSWENDRWMNHPLGANLAAVQSALESTPGSFWTDGTTLYVHPFGDTNPASDGQSYTRSYHRGAPFGTSAVMCLAPDLWLSGLRVRKTCLADPVTNDPVAAYCYQTSGATGGTSLMENCYGDYGSKHVFGFTDDDLNRHYFTTNCQAEQGSPYVGAGGTTPWVDYADNPGSNGTATHVYSGCTTVKNTGLIGSTAGLDRGDIPAWITHNNGGFAQFAEIDFVNCNLAGAIGSNAVLRTLRFTGGSCDGAKIDSTQTFFTGVRSTQPLAETNGHLTARNCLVTISYLNGGGAYPMSGTNDIQGCTFDGRTMTSNTTNVQTFVRSGALNLTWRNNLFLSSPTIPMALLAGATSTDALAFDHNAYAPGTDAVLSGYNDGSLTADRSLAQWQALGEDASSLAVANPLLNANDFPAIQSPLVDAGANLGALTDYTGRPFNNRRTIGALEPLDTFARWQAANFSVAEIAQPGISGSLADPDGDGLPNLLEYALSTPARTANASGIVPGVLSLGGQNYLTLTFSQREYSADLTYAPQVSSDLGQWQGGAAAVVTVGATDNGDGTATTVVRDAQPVGTTARRFLRLQVSAPGTVGVRGH